MQDQKKILKDQLHTIFLTKEAADKMKLLFTDNELLNSDVSVIVHNDFADWNLLTDDNTITGIIDWDEQRL